MRNSRISFTIVSLAGLLLLCANSTAATDIIIKISPQESKAKIDQKIFGTSILGWEVDHGRNKKPNKMGADYGYGVWDGKWNEYVQDPRSMIKGIKVGSVRLIGQFTDWEKGIEEFGKKEYAFGLNEQLRFSQDIGAEPVICLQNLELTDSYIRLFGYLKEHYPNVEYVEIGNESYDILSPEEYADRYLFYYEMIKSINPYIKIGFVGRDIAWERKVLTVINDRFDFIVEHYYPHGGKNNDPNQNGNKVFADLFPKVIEIENHIQNTLNLMDEIIGKRKPIAVTEYNAWFVQEKPVPYRHSLGAALINAELLRIFMKPENNILMANNWNFINEYWGMIANGFNGKYETLNSPYYKRPNYYVFEMYAKHFGDELISFEVISNDYDSSQYNFYVGAMKDLSKGRVEGENVLSGSWNISSVEGVHAKEKESILSLDFDEPKQWNYYHSIKTATIAPDTFYLLSGYIKTEDLVDDIGVSLEVQDARGWNVTHSAASTDKINPERVDRPPFLVRAGSKGDTDWHYVKALYKTLPDARSVNVIARRIGEKGPLKGKAYFKDIKFEKFVLSISDKISYLSVNASRSLDGNKIYLMVINKNMYAPMTTTIELKDFILAKGANAWVLNGPSVDAINERNHENVKVTHHEFEIPLAAKFEFTFEPHSLTAIELTKEDSNEK